MGNLNTSINDITKKDMLNMIENYNNVVLLDVRSKQEYNEGHLRDSINIPVFEIKRIARKILDYNSIIIVYCNEGERSKKAIQILKILGYRNLYNIKNGVNMYE